MKFKVSLYYLLTTSLLALENYEFNINLEYSSLKLDGHQRVATSNNNIDFSSMGISRSKDMFIPTIDLIYKQQHKFHFSYYTLEYNEKKLLTQDIYIYDDTIATFPINTNMDTNMDTTLMTLGYRNIKGDFSYGFDIKNYKYDVKLSNKKDDFSVENSFTFLTLNLDTKTNINKYNLNYGVGLGDGSDIQYINLYLEGGYSFDYKIKPNLSLGYRMREFYIFDGIYESFHRYQGPYVNLNVKF
ncbi:MAG: hypothetical protein U9Q20_04085 [Campylobacterota bacterium]|nr:hypothetical protein [Campylobacterota bacterium]